MLRSMILALSLLAFPATALAHACPALMAEIDAALPGAELSEEDMARVTELRQQGEEQHQAGDHDASMASLEEAKTILGI